MEKAQKWLEEAKKAEGVGVLLMTPFTKDYQLNEKALRQEVDWCIKVGAHTLWPTGYIGEWNMMEEKMIRRTLEVVADQNKGRLYISAGCHGQNTWQIIERIKFAEQLGYKSAWVSPLTPRPMTPDEIFDFYKTIHDNVSIPIGPYSTYAMGVYIRPSLMRKIAELERALICKDAVGDYCHIAGLYYEGIHKNMTILGVPNNMTPHMIYGGKGCTTSPQDLPLALGVYNAFKAGDMEKCWKLQLLLTAQWPVLMSEALAGRVYGAKVATSLQGFTKMKSSLAMGIDLGPPLHPYSPATNDEIKAAKAAIETYPEGYKPIPFDKL